MSKPLTAWTRRHRFLAPGLPDWPTARAVLRGEQAYENAPSVLPAPAILPPAERRRASRVVKLALAIGLEAAAHAGADVSQLATGTCFPPPAPTATTATPCASNWPATTARFRRPASTIPCITPPLVTGALPPVP